jgi:hypothetical protein
MCTAHLGQHWPGPTPSRPAHGLVAHCLEQWSSHGTRALVALVDSCSRWRDQWMGRVKEDAGGVETQFEVVVRWETHWGSASTLVRSGGRKPVVLGGASHQEAQLVGQRVAQPQCPYRGGGGGPTWDQRRGIHGEAPVEVDGGRPRLASGSSSRWSMAWGKAPPGEGGGSCFVALVSGSLTAAAARRIGEQ